MKVTQSRTYKTSRLLLVFDFLYDFGRAFDLDLKIFRFNE